jgi:hypothetical protein
MRCGHEFNSHRFHIKGFPLLGPFFYKLSIKGDITMSKNRQFRKGQKMEIGYDLKTNYTGHKGGTGMSTAQGEMLSNYFSNSETSFLKLQQPPKK